MLQRFSRNGQQIILSSTWTFALHDAGGSSPEAVRTEPGDNGADEILSDGSTRCESSIPAVTHVDYSARIQTVAREADPILPQHLKSFEDLTGCAVVVNTSFNIRDEPIVCTPEEAYRCFMRTEMDYLILEDHVLDKRQQPGRENRELFAISTVLN